jgi:hypothetical protein
MPTIEKYRDYCETRTGSMVHIITRPSPYIDSYIIGAVCNPHMKLMTTEVFRTNKVPKMLCNHCATYLSKEEVKDEYNRPARTNSTRP